MNGNLENPNKNSKMESCLLCLEVNNNVESTIKANSIQWQELEVQYLIEKHLWSMETIQISSWICAICWQELYDFHKFYTRIDEVHKTMITCLKIEYEPDEISVNKSLPSTDLIEKQQIIIKEEHEEKFNDPLNLLDTIEQSTTIKIKRKRKKSKTLGEIPTEPDLMELSSEESSNDESDTESNYEPERKSTKTNANKCNDNISKLNSKEKDTFIADNFKITCRTCEIPFENFKDLLQHFKATHKERGYVVCCDKKMFKRRLLLEHVQYHLDPSYLTCCHCGKVFANRKYLKFHIKLHEKKYSNKKAETSNEISIESCNDDDSDVNSNYEPDGNSGKTNKMNSKEKDTFIAENFKKLTCNLCEIPMENFQELLQHFKKIHKQRGYVMCCDRKILKRRLLLEHINYHIDPSYLTCNQCGKILANLKCLRTHIETHGPQKEKTHCCDICGLRFNSRFSLESHGAKHVSEEEKSFPCSICGKNFGNNLVLTNHVRSVHLRPTATCDICGLILSNSTVLNRHKSLKHPVGEIQEYTCSICSKKSTNLHAHRTHIKKVHEMGYNHKCKTCDRGFKTPRALMEHEAIHTGTNLYSCPWCPKKSRSNAFMHAHRKKFHRKEWEEENRKKYGRSVPPNAT